MGEGQPASIAAYYHAATKYTAEALRQAGRSLDWSKQPPTFKAYPQAEEVDLRRYMPTGAPVADDSELERWRHAVAPEERSLAELAHLLYFTNGVTAVVPQGQEPFLMRAAPSAGGLYPTELYVVAKGGGALPAGIYHYQVRQHSLAKLYGGEPWRALSSACFDHPALAEAQEAVVLTGLFARSAWRYEDRAYRRVLLDTGHVLGNLLAFGWSMGWASSPLVSFADQALAELLGLELGEEGPLAVVALHPSPQALPPGDTLPGPRGPLEASRPGERLRQMHLAGALPAGPAPAQAAQGGPPPLPRFGAPVALPKAPLDWSPGLGMAILRRRSTRHFSGEGFGLRDLAAMLGHAYGQAPGPGEVAAAPCPALAVAPWIETYVVVHEVEGLEPGCYRYDPEAHSLLQVRFTALRREAHHLALGQALAASCAAIVVHAAQLDLAVARLGDRAYRHLHLDAGHLGQRLNLAAIALELGASGIGGFFDDEVNDLLGLPPSEAVLYLTTLGVPDHEVG